MDSTRTLSWDWYDGAIPANVELDDTAYIDTAYSFLLYNSQASVGMQIGKYASIYQGCMFDVGKQGSITIGEYSLLNGAWIICDASVEIGNHALISWNVVFMDTYRVSSDPLARRQALQQVPFRHPRRIDMETKADPIRIHDNVWIGFDCCVMPGVSIGEGSIVGARSVVFEDVEPYTIVAGNPARFVRHIEEDGK